MDAGNDWKEFDTVYKPVTSVELSLGDMVHVPPWELHGEASLMLVVSISKGHTRVVIKFLYSQPNKGLRTETYFPNKHWYVWK